MNLQTDFAGLRLYPGYLDRSGQVELLAALRNVLAAAPLFTPRMPKSGRPFSVRMSNCGPLGWVSDESGYRYQRDASRDRTALAADARGAPRDMERAWPIPGRARSCLINFYGPAAKMGLHQDRDEEDFDAPVVSISLGDSCLFRVGGLKRGDPTRSFRLGSGDALVLGGGARLAFHGVDRIYPGTSSLLPEGGRINLTLRRVTRPAVEGFPWRATAEALHHED